MCLVKLMLKCVLSDTQDTQVLKLLCSKKLCSSSSPLALVISQQKHAQYLHQIDYSIGTFCVDSLGVLPCSLLQLKMAASFRWSQVLAFYALAALLVATAPCAHARVCKFCVSLHYM